MDCTLEEIVIMASILTAIRGSKEDDDEKDLVVNTVRDELLKDNRPEITKEVIGEAYDKWKKNLNARRQKA